MLCFVFAALVVVLDQLFKYWITIELASGGQISIIPKILELTYLENTGAAFGIFENSRWPLAAVSLVGVIILIAVIMRYDGGFWGNLGLASVLGGAAGNMVDRILQGYVVDMFQFKPINFAVFNIADCFITIGAVLFCIHLIFSSRSKDAADDPDDGMEPAAIDVELDDDYDVRIAPGGASPSAAPRQYAAPVAPVDDVAAPAAQQPDSIPQTETAPLPVGNYDIDDILPGAGDLDVSETRILEEYDLERLLSEYDRDGAED